MDESNPKGRAMNRRYPVFTLEAECQDCYKCLRHCPTKSISVSGGHAVVQPERCVACGRCVTTCPARAKTIRNDRGVAKRLIASGRTLVAAVAPSWVAEFGNLDEPRLVAALKQLGFHHVSETALGAQEISAATAAMLTSATPGLYLSSACPVAVDYIRLMMPRVAPRILPMLSPALAHARLLKTVFGPRCAVVFFGPCAAKKNEADRHPDLLDVALTFQDLRELWQDAEIDPERVIPIAEDRFEPERATDGALYPVEGGMIRSIEFRRLPDTVRVVSVAGLEAIHNALAGMDDVTFQQPVFVECLACAGGCVAGPCATPTPDTLARRLRVEDAVTLTGPTGDCHAPRVSVMDASFWATPDIPEEPDPGEDGVRQALRRVGKTSAEDELNCGGCGYNTCRDFARALALGRAEPTMCVSWMRKLAQKKANALLRCMPSGVVIVDRNLRIVECNEAFARLFGDDLREMWELKPGLAGCRLSKVVPFVDLFESVLLTGRECHYDHYRCANHLYDITVFSLDPGETVGAVIQDVTRQEFQRDEIARKANEVITRNLLTVQEIACRLGEHMAETEILLRSIAEAYAPEGEMPPGDEPGAPLP